MSYTREHETFALNFEAILNNADTLHDYAQRQLDGQVRPHNS